MEINFSKNKVKQVKQSQQKNILVEQLQNKCQQQQKNILNLKKSVKLFGNLLFKQKKNSINNNHNKNYNKSANLDSLLHQSKMEGIKDSSSIQHTQIHQKKMKKNTLHNQNQSIINNNDQKINLINIDQQSNFKAQVGHLSHENSHIQTDYQLMQQQAIDIIQGLVNNQQVLKLNIYLQKLIAYQQIKNKALTTSMMKNEYSTFINDNKVLTTNMMNNENSTFINDNNVLTNSMMNNENSILINPNQSKSVTQINYGRQQSVRNQQNKQPFEILQPFIQESTIRDIQSYEPRPPMSKQVEQILKFQEKYLNYVRRIIYITNLEYPYPQGGVCFLLKIQCNDGQQMKRQLIDQIEQLLYIGIDGLKYQPLNDYKIFIQRQNQNTNLIDKQIIYHLEIDPLEKRKINFKTRKQICNPDQIMKIQLFNPIKIIKTITSQQLFQSITITIIGFKRNKIIDQISQLQREEFVLKKIMNHTPSSLLLKLQFISPLTTSFVQLGSGADDIIKPYESIKTQIGKDQNIFIKPFQYVCMSNSVLFYHNYQINQQRKRIQNYDELFKFIQKINFNQNSQNENMFMLIKQQIQNIINNNYIDEEKKSIDFLFPIFLYMKSSFIHDQLDTFLKEVFISLFKQSEVNASLYFWKYLLSIELKQSLIELYNNIETVYLESIDFEYQYKINDIVQWRHFISTSTSLENIKKSLQNKIQNKQQKEKFPCIFQIKTYSAKDVRDYSQKIQQKKYKFNTQQKMGLKQNNQKNIQQQYLKIQFLLLPHTKFKVKSVNINENYLNNKVPITYVILQQLPIPKILIGYLIIWIDPQMQQNLTFYNANICKKHQKHIFGWSPGDFRDLIQLKSWQKFKQWFEQYKDFLIMPNLRIKIIMNMNKTSDLDSNKLTDLIKMMKSLIFKRTQILLVNKKRQSQTISSLRDLKSRDLNLEVFQNDQALKQYLIRYFK